MIVGLELKLGYVVLQDIDCGAVLPSENLFYNRTGEADSGLKGNPTFVISSFVRKPLHLRVCQMLSSSTDCDVITDKSPVCRVQKCYFILF